MNATSMNQMLTALDGMATNSVLTAIMGGNTYLLHSGGTPVGQHITAAETSVIMLTGIHTVATSGAGPMTVTS